MKAKALLISKEMSESNATITEAAARAGLWLLKATDAKQAFEILRSGLADIDLVIIDVDPGIHGMAILEAITSYGTAPPVIVVTGFEQFEMAPIARRHGAAACIAKPFTAAQLVARFEHVWPVDCAPSFRTCDAWGHLYPSRYNRTAHECGNCASRATTTVSALCRG
jgi:DNA-binding NtrC family response regulator